MIKITKIKEYKDGSATLYLEYNSIILHPLLRRVYNKKRITKKLVKKFVSDSLTYAMKKDYKK